MVLLGTACSRVSPPDDSPALTAYKGDVLAYQRQLDQAAADLEACEAAGGANCSTQRVRLELVVRGSADVALVSPIPGQFVERNVPPCVLGDNARLAPAAVAVQSAMNQPGADQLRASVRDFDGLVATIEAAHC